ncbi:MAG TPA: tetratricopeptide repeat protein [Allosphingosinicella sp.]|jgi:hypothetical protein
MNPADDDISAALPRPPHPAPARREAAIAAAMRRFDGVGEPEPTARRPAPAASWSRRPYFGALAGAALVAVIALPLAWTSFDEQPYRDSRKPPTAGATPGPEPAAADPAIGAPSPSPSPAPPPQDRPVPPVVPSTTPDKAPAPALAEPAQAFAEPAPVAAPPPPAAPMARNAEQQPAETGADQIVVTGSRIARPNLQSASPLTVVESAGAATAARASAARSARRGDWNACTIEDPRRSLSGCQVPAEAADGLERAWKGDWQGAARAFDSAVAAAPRSSPAYLNRGLARRRAGELEAALADLDRAVRFSPRTARYYYHRGRVLRQLGDSVRARADEARAVELDPRYAALVGGP